VSAKSTSEDGDGRIPHRHRRVPRPSLMVIEMILIRELRRGQDEGPPGIA
jgi:hypothetical protein